MEWGSTSTGFGLARRDRILRVSCGRIAKLALLVTLLPACSPAVRLRTEVVLPPVLLTASYPPPGPAAFLNVSFTTASTPSAVSAPVPAVGPPAGGGYEAKETAKGFTVELTLHGRRHYVQIVAWFDANSDGRVDRGDAIGSLPAPVLAEDRGLFRGNLTQTPPIAVTLVP